MLKSTSQLEKIDKNSEDIYQTTLTNRYAARPDSLENMYLAEFPSNYTCSGKELEDKRY